MSAQIITCLNAKGGAGKTLACVGLGGALGERGFSVLICDTDPQQTAVQWALAAPDSKQFPAAVVSMASYGDKIHREIQKQLDRYDYILIDTPPALESLGAPQSALLVSHLAIIPLQPSPADLWATRGVKALIQQVKVVNEDLRAVILPNRIQRTSLSKAIVAELDNFGIPVMKSRLSNRTAYQEAVLSGSTIAGLGRDAKAAAIEVAAMTDEILTILGDAK